MNTSITYFRPFISHGGLKRQASVVGCWLVEQTKRDLTLYRRVIKIRWERSLNKTDCPKKFTEFHCCQLLHYATPNRLGGLSGEQGQHCVELELASEIVRSPHRCPDFYTACIPHLPYLFDAEQLRQHSIGQEQRPRPLPLRRISRPLPPSL